MAKSKPRRRAAVAAGRKVKSAAPRRKAKPAARRAAAPRQKARQSPETLRLRAFTPGLTVNDLDRSIAFYTKALGFIVGERWERDGRLVGVMLKAGASELGLSQDDWQKGRDRTKGVAVRLWCETAQDIDALAARARAAGHALTEEPKDQPWGGRAFSLDDPDGFHLTIFRS